MVKTVLVENIENPSLTRRMTEDSAKLNSQKWSVVSTQPDKREPIAGTIKVCICTAIWQRHHIFRMFAESIKQLKGAEISVIVAGSEKEVTKQLVESYGFVYVEHVNQPLAKKHNAAIRRARELKPHYCILTGSDDIISQEAFDVYLEQMRKGVDFIGVLDYYFYDTVNKKASYWGGYNDARKGATCGAYRAISARLMHHWGWMPFEVKHSHVLDNSIEYKLKKTKHSSFKFKLKDYKALALDVKSEVNMTPFKLWPNTRYIKADELINKFPCLTK